MTSLLGQLGLLPRCDRLPLAKLFTAPPTREQFEFLCRSELHANSSQVGAMTSMCHAQVETRGALSHYCLHRSEGKTMYENATTLRFQADKVNEALNILRKDIAPVLKAHAGCYNCACCRMARMAGSR